MPTILYIYKENYTRGTSILVCANRANKSSPANNCVLLQTKLGGIGDFFDLFDRHGIYRSTLSVSGCRLVDKASCCRIQACSRQCRSRIIEERNILDCRSVLVTASSLGQMRQLYFYYFCQKEDCGLGAQLKGFVAFSKVFLSPVGCRMLCVGCKGVGVHCWLYLPVVELFVVGCRVSVVGCRVLALDCRVSLTLVVVLVPGCRGCR